MQKKKESVSVSISSKYTGCFKLSVCIVYILYVMSEGADDMSRRCFGRQCMPSMNFNWCLAAVVLSVYVWVDLLGAVTYPA